MFRVLITDDSGQQTILDTVAEKFVFLSQNGNAFSKAGEPADLITQLGMLDFAQQKIQAEIVAKEGK